MRINAIKVQKGPYVNPFIISENLDFETNWITVLIGPNGSRKSLLLRLLCDASLNKKSFRSENHPTLEIELQLLKLIFPHQVIALSGTPLDRFPRTGNGRSPNKYRTGYDKLPYIYFGQRASNGMAGTSQSLRNLSLLFLKHSKSLLEKKSLLEEIFKHLELTPTLGIKLRKARYLYDIENGKRKFSGAKFHIHLTSISAEVNRNSSVDKNSSEIVNDLNPNEIYAFVDRLKSDHKFQSDFVKLIKRIDESKTSIWLSPDLQESPNHPKFEITLWKCAIFLGFIEIEDISFVSMPNFKKPSELKLSQADEKDIRNFSAIDIDSHIVDADLSSGQWNWLSTLVGLALELKDNTLILIDEPENSLHPNWQRDYVKVLHSIMESNKGCHAIVATHSAFIASSLEEHMGNVLSLVRSNQEDEHNLIKIVGKPIEFGYGWNSTDVYEEIFGLESTRAPDLIAQADAALALIRDGIQENLNLLSPIVESLKESADKLPAHDSMKVVLESIYDSIPR